MRSASRTVRPSGTRGRWGTNARMRASLRPRSLRTSVPSQRTLPAENGWMPAAARTSVDLPAPFGPDDGDQLARRRASGRPPR